MTLLQCFPITNGVKPNNLQICNKIELWCTVCNQSVSKTLLECTFAQFSRACACAYVLINKTYFIITANCTIAHSDWEVLYCCQVIHIISWSHDAKTRNHWTNLMHNPRDERMKWTSTTHTTLDFLFYIFYIMACVAKWYALLWHFLSALDSIKLCELCLFDVLLSLLSHRRVFLQVFPSQGCK